jgi:hypothetical protein
MKATSILAMLALLTLTERTAAFVPKSPLLTTPTSSVLRESSTASSTPELTEPEQRVYGLLEELHASELAFRIVVVGNGAILESTSTLGPKMKLSQSPASGANLVTFASEDSSFEFHIQTAAVSKVALVEKEGPSRTMRILRFINDTGKPICSLILSEDSEAAAEWYKSISSKYGSEMQL